MPSISDFILSDQPLETAGSSVYPYSSLLTKKLTFTSRHGDDVELFLRDGNKILVPRALTPIGKIDNRVDGPKVIFPKEPIPRDYQESMFGHVDNTVDAYESGVFKASTGWGKTLIGYRAAWKAQTRTLAVTTKEDIFKQWVSGAHQFLGLPEDRVGIIRQDKCQVLDKDFVVAMIHSLRDLEKYPEHIRTAFGLVLFDEVHRLPADSFAPVAYYFAARRRYGLSATTNRSDEKEVVFHAHLGPIIYESKVEQMVPKVIRVETEWECPKVVKVNSKTGEKKVVCIPHEPGKTAHIEKIIAVDDKRNALIAELLKAAMSKGRNIVVFSTQKLHLEQIEKALLKAGVPKLKIGWYVGEATKEGRERRDKMKTRMIKLSTYSMMGEGTSIDELDTALLAMPRKDVVQPVGRIRRLMDGKRFPLVIDLVDNDSYVFKSYSMARLRWYRSIEAEVEN